MLLSQLAAVMFTRPPFYLVIEKKEEEDDSLRYVRIRSNNRDKRRELSMLRGSGGVISGYEVEVEIKIPRNREVTESEKKAMQYFLDNPLERGRFRGVADCVINLPYEEMDAPDLSQITDREPLREIMEEALEIIREWKSKKNT